MEAVFAFLVAGGVVSFLLSMSPIGRAVADRIRARGPAPAPDPELLAEVESLRHDLSELQERVDFTERLLAQEREARRLEPGH